MKKFVWTQEYSVGIESIDEQHQHFFDIANKIMEMSDSNSSEGRDLFESLEELGNYAFYHLDTEENYFDEYNFEGKEEHVNAHNLFRKKVNEFMDRARKGEDIKKIMNEAASYSGEWLLQHILIMDKKYTKFLVERGVK